ncbi:MAG TPA: HD domain-containing protein [Gemmatirosa sp.]
MTFDQPASATGASVGTTFDAARLLAAVDFAAARHRYQRRKDGEGSPYINHCVAVATVLATVGGVTDVDTLAAALLHDTVEDTGTTPDELEHAFGLAVSGIVAEVTDDKSLPKSERKRLQIVHARTASRAARLVKLGDKICNVRDVTHAPPAGWSDERRLAYLRWSAEVVDGCRGTNAALEAEFDRLLAEGLIALGAPSGA